MKAETQVKQVIDDRFAVAELIGEGGVGEVYRGRDLQTGEPVAIKRLKPDLVESDPEILERFTREADALARLNHPSIVKLLATAEQSGQHYLVLEYVGGGSLKDLMRAQGPLPVGQVVDIALDLADALSRVHRLKIVHRDIKPSNILLAEDGTARLTDFGVARLSDRTRLTQAGALIGTLAYLCPEGCNGEELDYRADVWSLGVVLHEMLAGVHPFAGSRAVEVVSAILQRQPPDLADVRPDVPAELALLVQQMLEKDRDRRMPSVRLLGAELDKLSLHVATASSAAPLARDLSGPMPRFRTLTPPPAPLSHPTPGALQYKTPTPTTGHNDRTETATPTAAPLPAARPDPEAPPLVARRGRDLLWMGAILVLVVLAAVLAVFVVGSLLFGS